MSVATPMRPPPPSNVLTCDSLEEESPNGLIAKQAVILDYLDGSSVIPKVLLRER